MLHYGGKWITKSLLVYDKKYVSTRRDTSADLLDYDKIVEEYTKNLGFVLVKQIVVIRTSGKFYLLEGSEGIKTLQCLLNKQFKFVEGEQGETLKRKRGRTEEESEEKPKEEVEEAYGQDYDVNSSAPRPTQDEEYHFMSTLGVSQQQYEPFGPAREPESDPDIRP
uniref:Transposon MuDR mudrA n=1 Tax=Solanum tuberosum TaxID=4113 RepID=M1DCY9_SOLTU